MVSRPTLLVLAMAFAALGAEARSAKAAKPDPLAQARQLYNQGEFDRAIEAAQPAATQTATASSARLIQARSRLERYRRTPAAKDLENARADFQAVNAAALDPREKTELQVGLGELLFLEEHFGAAAEMLAPVVDQSALVPPDSRERALEWWAMALDRQAQSLPPAERPPLYARVIERMEEELKRDPASLPGGYWLPAAARAAGDLDRAWSAAQAGWIRAAMARDRGMALRTDLDKLVTQGIIPDRAAKAASRDRHQAAATLTAEWEAFKKNW